MVSEYTKEELLEMAAPYFEQGKVKMWGTSDGNLFYEESRHDALNHSKTTDTQLFELDNIAIPEQAPETNVEVIEQIRRERKPSKNIENVE